VIAKKDTGYVEKIIDVEDDKEGCRDKGMM